MRCSDCPRYDGTAQTCRDGKLNPRTLTEAIEVRDHLGPRAICVMNEHREQIIDIHHGAMMEGKPPRRPHTPHRAWRLEI